MSTEPKTAFTPGPWHDDGYRIHAPTTDPDKRNGRVIVEYKHVDDFNYADAHLIAAAPDLYEALATFPVGSLDPDTLNRWLNKRDAALARARGEVA